MRGLMGDLSKNFSSSEFWCPCGKCERLVPKRTLIDLLQRMRFSYGKTMVVTSGVRCREHNATVGGAPDSRHLPEHRDGADIACPDGDTRYDLVRLALREGATFVKLYPRHIHVDVRPSGRSLEF